jgi:hypothetical protein
MATNQQPSVPPKNSWDLAETRDEIVEEIHAGRARYAAEFDYDLQRIFEDLQAKEAQNPAPRANLQPLEPTNSVPAHRKT